MVYAAYLSQLDTLLTHMKTQEVFSSCLNKLKTRYLQQRQAPQEILEPNEVNEEEEEDAG